MKTQYNKAVPTKLLRLISGLLSLLIITYQTFQIYLIPRFIEIFESVVYKTGSSLEIGLVWVASTGYLLVSGIIFLLTWIILQLKDRDDKELLVCIGTGLIMSLLASFLTAPMVGILSSLGLGLPPSLVRSFEEGFIVGHFYALIFGFIKALIDGFRRDARLNILA